MNSAVFSKSSFIILLGISLSSVNSTDNFTIVRSFPTTTAVKSKLSTVFVPPPLVVDVGANKTIYLPNNSVTLTANVRDNGSSKYEYEWELVSKPSNNPYVGSLEGKNDKELKLKHLILGEYRFKVTVHGNNTSGKALVFVFVKPAIKKNEAPVAIIKPTSQVVQLPSNIILDGSGSTDDDKIISYHWETVRAPIEMEKNINDDQALFQLDKNIIAGNYTFKLTVTDSHGKTGFATVNLTALPEKDYPPKADPGPNLIVNLPINSAILNGNGSTDDKKIVSYEWSKISDNLTADMQGVREPVLRLAFLQEGTYTFNLKVTDSAKQSSSKEVKVFVKPRVNVSPTARVTDRQIIVRLPATEAILNGSLSSDDDKIVKYEWQQVSGEPMLNIVDGDKPIAYVNDLKIGVFQMKLTVWDSEKLKGSDIITLRVEENQNQVPKAVVPISQEVHYLLPNLVSIDGSKSWDDHKIVKYQWFREDDSLVVGDILADTDSKSILLLSGLLPGVYKFKLTVYDEEGLSDSSVTTLVVLPSTLEKYFVQLQFVCSLTSFTESKKNTFLSNIQLIIQKKLDSDPSQVKINLMKIESIPFIKSVSIIFYATLHQKTLSTNVITTSPSVVRRAPLLSNKSESKIYDKDSNSEIKKISALTVLEALNEVKHDPLTLIYPFLRIETFVCQNNCSGHGHCNALTKLCECDAFWTNSFVRERFGDGRPNCDWSIIYVVIFFSFVFVTFIALIWLAICLRRKKCANKKKSKMRKHKYMRLSEYGARLKGDQSAKFPKSLTNGIKSRVISDREANSFVDSDSNMSSDEDETMFINNRNGTASSLLSAPVTNEQSRKNFS